MYNPKNCICANFSQMDPFLLQKMTVALMFTAALVPPLNRSPGLLVTAAGALVSASIAGTAGLGSQLVGAGEFIN